MPNLCMAAQTDVLQHKELAGNETKLYVRNMAERGMFC